MIRRVLERQWLHAIATVALLAGLAVSAGYEPVRAGAALGVGTPVWLWVAAGIAILHQAYVWICWRVELHGSLLTRWLGSRAFDVFAVGFAVLGVARVVALVVLAVANRGSLGVDPLIARALAGLALLPALYLFYSVHRWFGFRRAFGIDHFDPAYRSLPLVRRGIFRWTPNAMYTFGFLLLWAIALWFGSVAALAAALFNHLYVWVHYLATERPDMRRLYGTEPPAEPGRA